MTRAMTLIETLLVLVLIGLVASLTASAWSTAPAASRLREAESSVLDLDARARLLARRVGPVILELDHRSHQVVLRDTDSAYASIVVSRGIDAGLKDASGRELEQLGFDARGRTSDYELQLTSQAGSRRTRVSGLTGWAEASEP